jgi:DNA-directed RNA polymerase specialized sigma24 family protein
MAQNINPEAFKKFLSLLDPNEETAGVKYETIRRRLMKFFENRSCHIAEELSDETMDRAIRKIHEMEKYVGDPLPYCFAVAKKVFLEFMKSPKFRELTEMDAEIKEDLKKIDDNDIERLQKCLKKLTYEERDLIQRYYNNDTQKKTKDMRREIEIELNIPNTVLRARIHRIKASLFKCMEKLRRE